MMQSKIKKTKSVMVQQDIKLEQSLLLVPKWELTATLSGTI